MRLNSKHLAVVAAASLWLVLSPVLTNGRQSGDAVATARAFYRMHFTGGLSLLKGKKKWLTPELYGLISAEMRHHTAPDEVGYFDGDPWTDSQETPASFRIGKADVSMDTATVEIVFRWFEGKKSLDERECRVKLEKRGGHWLISDIISHDGESLFGELRKRNRN